MEPDAKSRAIELRFLRKLWPAIAAVALLVLGLNVYSRFAVEHEAERLLSPAQPDAAAMVRAFELLKDGQFFAGVGEAPEPEYARVAAEAGADKDPLPAVQRRLFEAYRAAAPVPGGDRAAVRRHPSVWIQAFGATRARGNGTPDAFDATMLRDLLETRRNASSNGLVFGCYLLLASATVVGAWMAVRITSRRASLP